MRACNVAIVLALVLAGASAGAAERMKMAVLDTAAQIEKPPKGWLPGEYVRREVTEGIGKVPRFEVMEDPDVLAKLEEKKMDVKTLDAETGAAVAKLTGARLVLLPRIDSLKIDRETEDLVVAKRQTVVCRASVSGVLYDARTGKVTTLGPYLVEDTEKGAADDKRTMFGLDDEDVKKLAQRCLASAARSLRSRVYKLHPLAGVVSSVVDDDVVIDIGKRMGVDEGDTFAVFAQVTEEDEITGLKQTRRTEVARLKVQKVDDAASHCRILRGDTAKVLRGVKVVQVFD